MEIFEEEGKEAFAFMVRGKKCRLLVTDLSDETIKFALEQIEVLKEFLEMNKSPSLQQEEEPVARSSELLHTSKAHCDADYNANANGTLKQFM